MGRFDELLPRIAGCLADGKRDSFAFVVDLEDLDFDLVADVDDLSRGPRLLHLQFGRALR